MKLKPLVYVLASAVLFGISTPLAKLLLGDIHPVALAGLLYLGVFAGLAAVSLFSSAAAAVRHRPGRREAALERGDLRWLAGAILAGGVLGPVCLMAGLNLISGFSASLLLNFEGAATAVIAVVLFKENAGGHVWLALLLMTASGVLLSWNPGRGPVNLLGPVLVVAAMIFWGLDNNLTGHISDKDPVQIARLKGLVAGIVSTAAAFLIGQGFRLGWPALCGLAIGGVCYGLSLVFYVRALKNLGAFRTGLFFSIGPFVGSLASLLILKDRPAWTMIAAGPLMVAAVVLMLNERHAHSHKHLRTIHAHSHTHDDLHHAHAHAGEAQEPHSHEHIHEELEHRHGHWPDTHHRHGHEAGNPKEER